MQMTYAQLSRFGTLRKVNKLGPYGVFLVLQKEWGGEGGMTPREVAHKVKLFFHFFQVCLSLFVRCCWMGEWILMKGVATDQPPQADGRDAGVPRREL